MNQGLLAHAPNLLNQPGSYGSVVFRFAAHHAMNLHAAAVVTISGAPVAFLVPAHPAGQAAATFRGNGPGSVEGIWWQPLSGLNDILVISNSSEKTVSGTLSLFDASGKQWSEPLSLGPRQTQRMATSDLLQQAGLSGSYGGISLAVPTAASAVSAFHLMYDDTGKSSLSLEMFSRDPAATLQERTWAGNRQWTAWAPMLALRVPDPAAGLPPGTVLQPTIFVRNTTAKQLSAGITLSWRGDSGQGQVKLPALKLDPFATQQWQIGPMQKQLGIPDDAHWALVTLTSPGAPDDLIATASSYDANGQYGLQTRFSVGLGRHFAGGEWRADAAHNTLATVTNGGSKATSVRLTLHYDNGKQKYEMQQTIQPGGQMWVNFADLIHNRTPDRQGNLLPADLTSATYDVQDLSPGPGSLAPATLAVNNTLGSEVHPDWPICCGAVYPGWSPVAFDLLPNVIDDAAIDASNSCTGGILDISGDFTSWFSANPAVAQVTTKRVQGVAPGFTTGSAKGAVLEGGGAVCVLREVQVNVPITVQVPTSLGGPRGTKTTYNNGTLLDCYGQSVTSPFYGYEECEAYTVLDQESPPKTILQSGIQFDENIQVVATNIGLTSHTATGETDSGGYLRDMLTLGSATHAPAAGSYVVDKQTITLHSTGAVVRVSCLDFESTDVTVKDITSAPNTTCTRN